MPGKIKSAKQFRFLEMMAHGKKNKSIAGPSAAVASKILGEETHTTKSKFAKEK